MSETTLLVSLPEPARCECGHLHPAVEQDGRWWAFHRCQFRGCDCRHWRPTPTSSPSGEPTPTGCDREGCVHGHYLCPTKGKWYVCDHPSHTAAGASGGEGPEPLDAKMEREYDEAQSDPWGWDGYSASDVLAFAALFRQQRDEARRRLSEVEAETVAAWKAADGMSADLSAFHRKVAAAIDPDHHLCIRDDDFGGQYADPIEAIVEMRTALSTARLQLQEAKQEVEALREQVAEWHRLYAGRWAKAGLFWVCHDGRSHPATVQECNCCGAVRPGTDYMLPVASRSSGVPDA